MKTLYRLSTLLFWLAVGGFAAAPQWLPEPLSQTPPSRATGTQPRLTPAEMARHNREGDCWVSIDQQVYDLTLYTPTHPADPAVILAWCGKEASTAYHTKNAGRPHSPYADRLLPRYRLGPLQP
ncbi:cytochrome b5-like heme/steroid binding domain-containing protein [Zoogloea sp.]|uniref:cytochrome b5 domain-containing protein n=1 Tax=Zoogloea sp. TaxID=49181 RepID=UPI00262D23AA|nr:cytochrome b5-like heme/steroid binding domain-containing protein [Zoogloea sp.]MDD3353573.1 cytochrome b5-like heme/steroid binding domain-containing protein [Zoogloea sp.]